MGRKLPDWIRTRVPAAGSASKVNSTLREGGLNTVCECAHCPNTHECYGRGTATFMILGDTCTRNCVFCAVPGGQPMPADPEEPLRVARAAADLELAHVVVTSVTRDDLRDGGAGIFAETIVALRQSVPSASVEVLIPDFQGNRDDVDSVLDAGPDVLNHNLETVRRMQKAVRPMADYERSLDVLRWATAHESNAAVKSGIMVGLGETDDEVCEAMQDLYEAGCRLLTIGQYLAPSDDHVQVARYVEPDTFVWYKEKAMEIGFDGVASGPLVRSSYMARELLESARGDKH